MFVASEDYADVGLSLDERLIKRPASTFFMTAGEDAPQAGIKRGDLLIVDRAEPPAPGRAAVIASDGELKAARIPPSGKLSGQLWGVVLWTVRAP
jgi:DNA polymerase V